MTCLAGVPTYGVDLEAELVTPTGAAIVATVAQRFERWPAFRPERIGWGSGTRRLADRPNMLRAVLGSPEGRPSAESGTHLLIEANIDDMSGELAGHAIAMLLAAGALDAWATPITMKKGRPAFTISALGEAAGIDGLTAVMLRETTTIGVRRTAVSRTERPRRLLRVETPYGFIPVKISEGPFGPPQAKPEFEACARAAAEHGVAVREVIAAALTAAGRAHTHKPDSATE